MHIYVTSQAVVVTQAFFTASDQYESETRFCGCDFQFRFEKKRFETTFDLSPPQRL
jgi:hypothetical protein